MVISRLVPMNQAKGALLETLLKKNQPMETSVLVDAAIGQFPSLTPEQLKIVVPSGTFWWPGYFRLRINDLKKEGLVRSPEKGYWEITEAGRQYLKTPGEAVANRKVSPTAAQLREQLKQQTKRDALNWAEEVIRSIKKGEVAGIVTIDSKGIFMVEIGEHIKETRIEWPAISLTV